VKFQSNYDHEIFEPVEVDDELITEQTGYRTTKEIVEGMVMAGQRLSDYRHGILDNFDEDYDDEQDPAVVYENDPVELKDAVQRNVMRYRGKKKEVPDVEEETEGDEMQQQGEVSKKKADVEKNSET
jgi:hypothetical protein